jgi:ribosomal protein RSM22 (predicted rRNA methylase)
LQYLLDQRLSTIPQHTWVSKLFGFQFSVEFKPGHQNAAADALSHWDEEAPVMNALSVPNFELFDQFHQEASTLQEIVTKQAKIAADTTNMVWSIVDDIVVHDGRVFMSVMSKLWATVLEHAHGIG